MTTSTLSTVSTDDSLAATPEAAKEKTYPGLGLLLIVVSAAVTYGGLYLALTH
jgi:hypothetical protein